MNNSQINVSNVMYDKDISLVVQNITQKIINVHEFGAKKYGKDSWKEDPDNKKASILDTLHSIYRHVLALSIGRPVDPESGMNHLDHALCRLHMLISVVYYTVLNDHDDKIKNKMVSELPVIPSVGNDNKIYLTGEFRFALNKVLNLLNKDQVYKDCVQFMIRNSKDNTDVSKEKLYYYQKILTFTMEIITAFNTDGYLSFSTNRSLKEDLVDNVIFIDYLLALFIPLAAFSTPFPSFNTEEEKVVSESVNEVDKEETSTKESNESTMSNVFTFEEVIEDNKS